MSRAAHKPNKADENRAAGLRLASAHPVLAGVAERVQLVPSANHAHVAETGWVAVSAAGTVWFHPKRLASPAAWARIFGLVFACLGFGYVRERQPLARWELTALLMADRLLSELKLGDYPEALELESPELPRGGVEALFKSFCLAEPARVLLDWQYALCADRHLFVGLDEKPPAWHRQPAWTRLLADGIARGVSAAIEEVATGVLVSTAKRKDTLAQRARRQLMDYYPLLGALAASFDVEEDLRICQQYDIRVAAIDVSVRRVYFNPSAGLSLKGCLFVYAHELLHAGLNHVSRRRGREAVLWNVACDFVINAWLIEMQVGAAPAVGLLYDENYAGWSAEEIYDDLARDLRRARKLATFRGAGEADILGEEDGRRFVDAEAYCRRALAAGLDRCMFGNQRGLVPAGLIEEIRSLSQPPIPWDVRLAEWFDERFPPPELHRTYARPSRRQGATPDIPRPSKARPSEELLASRVFGVVLDTSGSMEPRLLGKALGAIASYALAREVSLVRLVCCDAAAYDAGWVPPESLLDRFTLKGRGGTVLQPGIDLLGSAAKRGDFPVGGPLLIITDGYCEERLAVAMDHAYLVPASRYLPFPPAGPVFQVDGE